AGIARKPGMSRDDLLTTNAQIVGGVVKQITTHSPNAVIIIVSNPLDVMTYLAWKKSGFSSNRVFGMAGVLDSSRYARYIATALKCSIKDVRAMVLGGHGDAMVPVPEYSTVNGVPITQLLSADQIADINDKTRHGGADIVKLMKTCSAYYAPSASAVAMVEAVLLDSKRILPACAYIEGEYGIQDLYCGVPVAIGKTGITKIIEIELSPDSKQALQTSANEVMQSVSKLDLADAH
ncbi:MAG: malate dehydrogenase, partial [Lentisphaeria bacterium]|nr:malate dehydrogenase [Lentisphaeria bacterium]